MLAAAEDRVNDSSVVEEAHKSLAEVEATTAVGSEELVEAVLNHLSRVVTWARGKLTN